MSLSKINDRRNEIIFKAGNVFGNSTKTPDKSFFALTKVEKFGSGVKDINFVILYTISRSNIFVFVYIILVVKVTEFFLRI